ncbi:P-loop NTPase [Desulfurococcaceae archaeon MEX13E-LK6-19]|nr:P-loop NTPase [Desulfurococcaceae archaeon MEX13E-LK6-19]
MAMEIVVASGKGGTGKTFISSNLVFYLHKLGRRVVAVDADAEAPDLLLALGGPKENILVHKISSSRKAVIEHSRCIGCLKCVDVCRFYALEVENHKPRVIREYCEGCGACSIVCPVNAIEFYNMDTGVVRIDVSRVGVPVVTADLVVGGRNTGELVYKAKEEASRLAYENKADVIVVDAAAGIGCPVISSIAGSDVLLVVVEPVPPSLQGAERLLKLARQFNVKPFLIINKYDLDPQYSNEIVDRLGIEVLGKIPYDRAVAESYANMEPILYSKPDHPVSHALSSTFKNLLECVEG